MREGFFYFNRNVAADRRRSKTCQRSASAPAVKAAAAAKKTPNSATVAKTDATKPCI